MAQHKQKKDIRTVKINISWTYATKIYIEVLRNPDANPESIATARNELLQLAMFVDGLKEGRSMETPLEPLTIRKVKND